MTATEDALTKLVGQGIQIERELRIRILRLEKVIAVAYQALQDNDDHEAWQVLRHAMKDQEPLK